MTTIIDGMDPESYEKKLDRHREVIKDQRQKFSKDVKHLIKQVHSAQEELEKALAEVDSLKLQLGMVISESKELRAKLRTPGKMLLHKLFRRGHYSRKLTLT